MKQVFSAIILALLATAAAGAQGTTKAQVFPNSGLQQQLGTLVEQARSKGSSGSTLGDYGSHTIQLSVRTTSGGAEVHAHWNDVIVVMDGSATLITGGTVIQGQTVSDGETRGTGIRDGVTKQITKGDIVHVPAGTPHQMKIPGGVVFSALVIKVRQ